jgi:enamine deaminase RidA (YjgF/YER057c/UK114 family)
MDSSSPPASGHKNLKSDFAEYNEAFMEFFNPPFPVRTTVGSQLYNILVEIDVVVALPNPL